MPIMIHLRRNSRRIESAAEYDFVMLSEGGVRTRKDTDSSLFYFLTAEALYLCTDESTTQAGDGLCMGAG